MRKWAVVLMIILTAGLAAGMLKLYLSADRTGPEIHFDEKKEIVFRDDMTKEELLAGVSATDEGDGDVSDSLVVESVYPVNDSGMVSVIFVAKDENNNVTKKEFQMEQETAAESDDGQAADTSKEAEVPETVVSEPTATPEPTVPPLTPEEQAKKTQEDKITQLNPQDPRFYLTEYLVKVPVGTTPNWLDYVQDIQDDADDRSELYKKIQITGGADTNTPGTYELTYYVIDSAGNISNGAVLTVVVE